MRSDAAKLEQAPNAEYNTVGERFFATMGIPIVAGRGFNNGDTETSRKVAVINRTAGPRVFPGSDPLGETFHDGEMRSQLITIVGICADAHYDRVQTTIQPTYYMPYRQHGDADGGMGMTYEISTPMKPDAIVPERARWFSRWTRNCRSRMCGPRRNRSRQPCGASESSPISPRVRRLALVLASIGIYGIMAYAVGAEDQRNWHPDGAGAQPGRVLRGVLGEASWMVALGAALGWPAR